MTNKTLFCSSYVSFCTFYASLRLIRTVFTRPQLKVCPKGLHSFAFYILIFDFPSRMPLMSLPANTYVHKRHLYNCRETFTDVMSALQNNLFMQNKAKFRKVKLDVNKVLTKDYERMDTWSSGKKQSQTNPNEPQTNPTCRGVASGEAGFKPNLSRRSLWRRRKQTQFKAKQTQFPMILAYLSSRAKYILPRMTINPRRCLLPAGTNYDLLHNLTKSCNKCLVKSVISYQNIRRHKAARKITIKGHGSSIFSNERRLLC
jgi:hypothetical protein